MAKIPVKKYLIVKSSRSGSTYTYNGPSWDLIDVERKDFYTDKADAEKVAELLSVYNPVGFIVEEKT